MKQVPWLFALWFGTMLAAPGVRGQVCLQYLTFSIEEQYATNEFVTNHSTGGVTTNQILATAFITTDTVVRDIAVDQFGPAYTNWTSATLFRETDAAGHEGIFLYKPNPLTNVNVSKYFAPSFTNNFTCEAYNNFNAISNINNITDLSAVPTYNDIVPYPPGNLSAITNLNFNVTNPILQGYYRSGKVGTSNQVLTDYIVYPEGSVSLAYVSLNTANLQFSLIGSESTLTTNLIVGFGKPFVLYSNLVQSATLNFCVGTYHANLGTNLLNPDPADFVSGPAHVYYPIGTSPPIFSPMPAADVFP